MTSLLKLYRFAPVRSMFAINKMNKSSVTHWLPSTMRCFSDDTKSSKDDKEAAIEKKRIVQSNYVPLSESNATIILDVEEEREKLKSGGPFNDNYDDHQYDAFEGLNADRGVRGVFEIEDLVEVLKRDRAIDIFVCKVPNHLKYVDYMCVATVRSPRHMKAITMFVRQMYKVKRDETDSFPRLEGQGSEDWVALDLGNIALHIFTREARKKYDIEQLWSVGAEFDAESNKPDDAVVEMYERHTEFLRDLKSVKKDGAAV